MFTSNWRPNSVDGGDGFFLPSAFEFGQRNSLGCFRLIVTAVLLHIHHYLSGHARLQSPANTDTQHCDWAHTMHFENYVTFSLHEVLLMKLQELIVRPRKLLEPFLVDQVCFATVALIFILFRPSDVQGCLRHSYSLSLHVPVNVQGLRAVLCLMTHNTDV